MTRPPRRRSRSSTTAAASPAARSNWPPKTPSSNPASGARKLRNLVQRLNAEFVVGSVHSGVMLAAIPIASELKTIYFSTGEATEATGSKGTRFSFRTGTDTYSIAAASLPWCVENFGKKWTIIYADYAWGQSTNQESKHYIEKSGGKVLSSIPIPLDAKDFVPYLSQIPGESEVLLPAFIGSLSVAFYTQAKNMGLDKKMKMYSSSASIESIAPDDIQGAAEGVYFFENFPRMLKAKDDPYHKEFIRLMGMDEVNAREIGSQRVMDKSHGWQAWEDLFAIKQAIEASGYKGRKDVEGVIQALEGMQMKNSLAHPQGDKIIRKEDHVGIIDCYISRVRERKARSTEANSEGRASQEHAAAAQLVADAGVTIGGGGAIASPPPSTEDSKHARLSEIQGLLRACRAGFPRRVGNGPKSLFIDRGSRRRRRATDRIS